MPRRTIDAALDVMKHMQQQGLKGEVPRAEVLKAITIYAGALPQTRMRYMQFMETVGLLKAGSSQSTVVLDYDKYGDLMGV